MTPEEQAAADLAAKELAEKEAKELADKEAAEKLKNPDADMIAKLVAEKVAEQLKDTKGKLDAAYAARDAAAKKAEALEKKEREAELKLLDETGKHKEAFDLRIAEANTKYEELQSKYQALEKGNLELTRDAQIRDALRVSEFRNDIAAEMGFSTIAGQLIRNEQGQWVHRSGVSIKDFVAAFAGDEKNSFLFKTKESSGGGSTPPGKPNTQTKSLFAKTQAEVLQMAAEGKLPARK